LRDVAQRADAEMFFAIPDAARDRDDVKAIVGTAELAIAQLAWQFPVNVRIVREAEVHHVPADVEFLGNR
jgi:hypothetical protein